MKHLNFTSYQLKFQDGEQRQNAIHSLIKSISYADRNICVEYDLDGDFGVLITGYQSDKSVAFTAILYNGNEARVDVKESLLYAIRNHKAVQAVA